MSVLTLDEAKAHLGNTSSGDDTELQAMIVSAEAVIAKRCGPLVSTATTASHVFGRTTVLQLPCAPAISLTSVTANDGTTVTLSDLTVTKSGTVEYTQGGYFGAAWYTVVYQAGRATVPTDLLLAIKELVRHLWTTQRGGGARPGPSFDQPSPAYLLPYRVQELIQPHLQPGFA